MSIYLITYIKLHTLNQLENPLETLIFLKHDHLEKQKFSKIRDFFESNNHDEFNFRIEKLNDSVQLR